MSGTLFRCVYRCLFSTSRELPASPQLITALALLNVSESIRKITNRPLIRYERDNNLLEMRLGVTCMKLKLIVRDYYSDPHRLAFLGSFSATVLSAGSMIE